MSLILLVNMMYIILRPCKYDRRYVDQSHALQDAWESVQCSLV